MCTTGYTGAFCDVYRTHTLLELEIAPLELSGFMRGPRIRFATMVCVCVCVCVGVGVGVSVGVGVGVGVGVCV